MAVAVVELIIYIHIKMKKRKTLFKREDGEKRIETKLRLRVRFSPDGISVDGFSINGFSIGFPVESEIEGFSDFDFDLRAATEMMMVFGYRFLLSMVLLYY